MKKTTVALLALAILWAFTEEAKKATAAPEPAKK
jgi:hypothetical protein